MSALRSARRARAGQEKPGFRRLRARWASYDALEKRELGKALGLLQDAVERQERRRVNEQTTVAVPPVLDNLIQAQFDTLVDRIASQDGSAPRPEGVVDRILVQTGPAPWPEDLA